MPDTIQPDVFLRRLIGIAQERGFSAQTYGRAGPYELVACHRKADAAQAPRLYLSSGIHGDEPAGPRALAEMLERDLLPHDCDITLCPLINPVGIERGTRENGQGVDLNRDFLSPTQPETTSLTQLLATLPPFQVSLCLHEDWESTGFYLYSLGNDRDEHVGRAMIEAAARHGPIDLASEIDGHAADAGLIARPGAFDIHAIEEWPEAFYLYSKSDHTHFTTESASARPMAERVATHVAAVQAALERLPSLANAAKGSE